MHRKSGAKIKQGFQSIYPFGLGKNCALSGFECVKKTHRIGKKNRKITPGHFRFLFRSLFERFIHKSLPLGQGLEAFLSAYFRSFFEKTPKSGRKPNKEWPGFSRVE
jgi:hypothetical protein